MLRHAGLAGITALSLLSSVCCSQNDKGGTGKPQLGTIGSDGRCPIDGGILDADATFARYAGAFDYTPSFVSSGCSIEPPADLTQGQHYVLTISSNPKRVTVQTDVGTREFSWDEHLDFACGDQYVNSLQIGSERDLVRVNFMYDDSPASTLVGACLGRMVASGG